MRHYWPSFTHFSEPYWDLKSLILRIVRPSRRSYSSFYSFLLTILGQKSRKRARLLLWTTLMEGLTHCQHDYAESTEKISSSR